MGDAAEPRRRWRVYLRGPTLTLPPMTTPAALDRLIAAIAGVYRGHRAAVELVAIAFLARGHVLIEDIPGVGKTTLARALAAAVGGSFKRLQCTPDLMPADVTGISIYDERERAFRFHPGPVFCDVLLADELNRTPPRTQSALLEALSEGQVTVEGEPRALSPTFFCIATQNPLDHVGTYPLPDSQRDRFLISCRLGYPDPAQELALLAHDGAQADLARLSAVMDAAGAQALRGQAQVVRVEDSVRQYLLELVRATRALKSLVQGASPRAGLGLQRACQARALLHGRDYVIPDDVQALAGPCLAHRVSGRAGQATEAIIAQLVESLPVPR
jgi:MoxR-like ATPase